MTDWVDPTDAEIEQVAGGIIDGSWPDLLPPGVDEICWIDEAWVPDEASHGVLMEYWRKQKAAREDGLFTTEMVDPVSIREILKNIMLLDVERGGLDARYRVYGTGISGVVGRDWTGHLLSEMNRSVKSNQALFYRACYRAVVRNAAPLFTHHQPLSWIDANAWQRLILPVHDADGSGVVRFLVCNVPTKGRSLTSEEWVRLRNQRYS